MKPKKITLFALSFALLCSCAQEKTIELPLTFKSGYSHFDVGYSGIHPISKKKDDPWSKTDPSLSALPEGLTDVEYGFVETNIFQTVYQNYLLGNITQEMYETLQKSWTWVPDTLNLSKTPLKTKVAFAYGKDAEGVIKMAVDANNNLDLSDDELFIPMDLETPGRARADSLLLSHGVDISHEVYRNNEIITVTTPLLLVYASKYEMYGCNLAQYATTQYKGKEIVVSSSGFNDLSYRHPSVAFANNELEPGSTFPEGETYSKNEYIEIDNKAYKIKEVNTNKGVLVLERADLPKEQLYSTQIGYKSHPFEGEAFGTETMISLEQCQGKYVLLDFWSTWCGPCIQEFPNLRSLYEKADTTKFEIIGIVCSSKPKTLAEMIEKHEITWPQIVSDEANKIEKEYNIKGYPTTLLIDPKGVIIAKDLRGEELEEKVLGLTE